MSPYSFITVIKSMFDATKEIRDASGQMAGVLSETRGLWRLFILMMIVTMGTVSWNQFWWGAIAIRMLFA